MIAFTVFFQKASITEVFGLIFVIQASIVLFSCGLEIAFLIIMAA
jgi:hypothetical protein